MNMLSKYILPQTILAGLAVAQQSQVYRSTIAGGSPYGSVADNAATEQDRELFAQANQNPNVTKSFEINPFNLGGVFNMGSNAIDTENVWTLRINVSDFAVPNARPEYPEEQPAFVDPHITNTVVELVWPENDSFRSALNGSTAPACVSITTGNFLPNVTNLFTEDNDIGDCEPILGQECINAILRASTDLDSCDLGTWENLPECASTLGASKSYDEYGLSRLSLDINSNRTAPNASYADAGYGAIANGTGGQYGFVSQTTDAYNGTNTTVYEEEANRLYVMALKISPYQGQSGLWSSNLFCMRANATQLAVDEESSSSNGGNEGSGGSGGSSGEEDSAGSPNSAAMLTPSEGSTISALSLAGLGIGIFGLL